MDNADTPALRINRITKIFPNVIANDNVSLDVGQGEIHGILGENGAGKSTLMNILYGLLRPDSGEISIRGELVEISSSKEAVDLGIGMVHQHFMLVENLTAVENVVLGLRPEHPPFLGLEGARKRFETLAGEYNLDLDPMVPVWQLPVGDQQWLEILKLLYRDVKILILDEPTAVLAPSQVKKLFATMHRLANEGRSIIFISHKLKEMKEVADCVTVLRDGHVVGTVDPQVVAPSELAKMMVGRSVFLDRQDRPPASTHNEVLEIKDLSCDNDRGSVALNHLNLTVYSGEIVGVAGVDGNGQRELAECIAGLRMPTEGTITIKKVPVKGIVRDPKILGYIPEDRRKTGLVLNFNVAENVVLKTFADQSFTQRGFTQWDAIFQEADMLVEQYDVKTPHSGVRVSSLSGGNQQKVVVGRELSSEPDLIIASQPTRGLDLGAVEFVHDMLLQERNRGAAVLFISTELPEVLALSDRIVVMFKGDFLGEVDTEDADVTYIGELMLGHKEGAPA
jgi:simple sugar transport system ATP-binding protein